MDAACFRAIYGVDNSCSFDTWSCESLEKAAAMDANTVLASALLAEASGLPKA